MDNITIGQLYIKQDGIVTVWEVFARMMDAGGVRHVRLRNINDPSMTKLIAESALRNQRFYRMLPPNGDAASSAPLSG